jgi:hypothetical protein
LEFLEERSRIDAELTEQRCCVAFEKVRSTVNAHTPSQGVDDFFVRRRDSPDICQVNGATLATLRI